jgi:hypothetical protein
MALPSSDRGGTQVIWVVVHTAEGARTKESLYTFFNNNQNASSHVGIDANGVSPDWVEPRGRYAWTLLNGNRRSVNAELCGFARWTRAQWLSTGTVDGCPNPRQMVKNTAVWVDRMCRMFNIPVRKLTPAQVAQGNAGILGHVDYSVGTGDGDHWDPGPNFPWDVLLNDVAAIRGGSGGQPAPIEEEIEPMFQSIDLPASPADGSVATKVIALPWSPNPSFSGITRVNANIVANNADVTLKVAHWQVNDGSRRLVPMVADGSVVKALADTGGQPAPAKTYALVIDYVAPLGASVIVEAAK